jgi:hypothetical protein
MKDEMKAAAEREIAAIRERERKVHSVLFVLLSTAEGVLRCYGLTEFLLFGRL